jgi:hypothetical protein
MKLSTALLYVVARFEVERALLRGSLESESHSTVDSLPPGRIPSLAYDQKDRTLAEIDQDGFLFAEDPHDRPFFDRRQIKNPRKHHRLLVVLGAGAVCVQKSLIPLPGLSLARRFRRMLGWEFYVEAAALLRLRGLPCVPRIRRITRRDRSIEIDFIWGEDLRRQQLNCSDHAALENSTLEFSAMVRNDPNLLSQVHRMLGDVVGRGVIPRDIQAANFMRGFETGLIYIVDFNLVYLRPVPGWKSYAKNVKNFLDGLAH